MWPNEISHTSANGRDFAGRTAEAGAEISNVVIAGGLLRPASRLCCWCQPGTMHRLVFCQEILLNRYGGHAVSAQAGSKCAWRSGRTTIGGAAPPRSCTATRTTTRSRSHDGHRNDAVRRARLYDLDQ